MSYDNPAHRPIRSGRIRALANPHIDGYVDLRRLPNRILQAGICKVGIGRVISGTGLQNEQDELLSC
jgi:hypothetical protein